MLTKTLTNVEKDVFSPVHVGYIIHLGCDADRITVGNIAATFDN